MTNADILKLAKERFKEIADFESTQRSAMEEDNRFAMVDQWEDRARKNRSIPGFQRPTLTVSILDSYLNYINNSNRQNKSHITVSPVDEGAQEIYAKNRQGLLKHIQYESKSEIAHQTMFECAVRMGRGHCIVNTMYVNEESFDQKITVDAVPDPLRIYMDVRRTKSDYSDCRFGFFLGTDDKEDFKKEHPNLETASWEGTNVTNMTVHKNDMITVQYWVKEEKNDELLLIEQEVDGQLVQTKILKSKLDGKVDPEQILESRKVKRPVWMWYKMTNTDIIDKRELVCREIPIVTMIGVEGRHKGELILYGLTRRLKDSCQIYNYLSSTEMEFLDISVKSPYIAAVGQTEGIDEWLTANSTAHPVLRYHPIGPNGTPLPPPQRITPPQPSMAHLLHLLFFLLHLLTHHCGLVFFVYHIGC